MVVLTHPMASLAECMPYHAIRLQPAPCLELYGRSAADFPQIKKHAAVYYFWKDPSE